LYFAPHHLKATAQGMPVVIVPLLLYTDDTSGNRSKKWNKLDCWCFLLAAMPPMKTHSCTTSTSFNQVTVMDMAFLVVEDLKILEKGIIAYDAFLKKEVLLIAP